MSLGFNGRRILVTGAARGIGLASAERFLAGGAQVACLDRDPDALTALADRPMVHTLVVDVADPLAPENLLKGSGRGIFLIRSFMDDVQLQRAPEGGMEVRMVKRAQPAEATDGSVTTS